MHLLPVVTAQYYLNLQKLIEIRMYAFQVKVILLLVISHALSISVNIAKEINGRLL